ncbi:hypothetical protein [Tautonia marina]|uniref:hypothetical protein n=1 Tax=Tautonia marina TaxID=2653855 RepID=UPI0012611B0F|nr:hypothetical protein [Tautonia marina]
MRSMLRWIAQGVALAGLLVVLGFGAEPASAQVVPFRVTGAGVADFIPLVPGQASPHDAIGTATHLGRYEAEGLVRLDGFTGPTTGTFSSAEPVAFTAANGDVLRFDYQGNVNLFGAGDGLFITVWIAEFTPASGSTGRFERVVDGSFIMTAISAPFSLDAPFLVGYSWSGSGWIEFDRGR